MNNVKKWFSKARKGKMVFIGFKSRQDMLDSFGMPHGVNLYCDQAICFPTETCTEVLRVLLAAKTLVGDGRYEAFILMEDSFGNPWAVIDHAGSLCTGADGTLQTGTPVFMKWAPKESTWTEVGKWLKTHFPDRASPGMQTNIFELVRAFVWNRTGMDPMGDGE